MRRSNLAWVGVLAALTGIGCGDDAPAAETTASSSSGGAGSSTSAATTTGEGSSESGADSSSSGGEPAPRLQGVADLHLHMFAEEAFGGGWFHGTVDGDEATALGPCDGGEPGDHAQIQEDLAPLIPECRDTTLEELQQLVPLVATIVAGGGEVMGEFIGAIPGTTSDTGEHTDRTGGFPDYEGWPRWDAIAHQQVWHQHLRQAYDQGLRIEVISAVSFDWLCDALPDENVTRPQCDEMDDVLLQLEMANTFAQEHSDWMEIALTPADARRIVEEDKLAVILSIEASHIFGDGDWRAQLDQVYDLGVRTLQPVHQLDNRFGGAAPHNVIFQVAQYTENCHIDYDCALTSPQVTLGFDVDEECRNVLGLTEEGRELVQEMVDRGMLVDAAHLSEQSVRDLFEILETNDYYPFYLSHAHFREIMPLKSEEEKTTPSWVVQMVRQTGGMIGLRTANEETSTYEPSPVDNTCQGSSRSFAQAYDFGRMGLGVAIGLGSDLNGFIQQTRPRFGPQACSASFPEEAKCQAKAEREGGVPPLGTDFDDKGMAHMGVVLDLIDDLEALGTDVEPLRTSADDWVTMWERVDARSGMADPAEDMDTSGVTVLPAHGLRRQDYPTECDITYCADATLSGEECRFDAECESGTCEGAGECGNPRGTCM